MTAPQAIAQVSGESRLSNFNGVPGLPWLDRTIAAIACIPSIYLTYYRYQHWHLGIPLIGSTGSLLIMWVTMIIRRPPKRVTHNPLYWLLALADESISWQPTRGSRIRLKPVFT